MTPEGSRRIPKGTQWPLQVSQKHREAAPRASRRMPRGSREACEGSLGTYGRRITETARASQGPGDPWRLSGFPRDLQGSVGVPIRKLGSTRNCHPQFAGLRLHGTYVPLSHWYQRLEASTSPLASGLSNVVGAGRVGCGKAVGGSEPVGRAAVIGT